MTQLQKVHMTDTVKTLTEKVNKSIDKIEDTAVNLSERVKKDVPENANFNDTVTTINGKTGVIKKEDVVALGIPAQDTQYKHPEKHSPNIIEQDLNNRFISSLEIAQIEDNKRDISAHTSPIHIKEAHGLQVTAEGKMQYFNGVSYDTLMIEKKEQTPPGAPVISDIKFESVIVTGEIGVEVSLDNISWFDSPHTFTGLTHSTSYSAYARRKETPLYLPSPPSVAKVFSTKTIDDTTQSPGSLILLGGDKQAGFYGEVSSTELISGDDLCTAIGLSSGTTQHSSEGWLKFSYLGKTQFISKKPIRHSLSWDQINAVGAVSGKEITIRGQRYKVRLVKGANKDPAGAYNGTINHNSEWNKLMLPIHEQAIDKSWAYSGNVESTVPIWTHTLGAGKSSRYTDADLLTHHSHGNGSYSWCQEVAESSTNRIHRGVTGVSGSNRATSSTVSAYYGFRPVVERII